MTLKKLKLIFHFCFKIFTLIFGLAIGYNNIIKEIPIPTIIPYCKERKFDI